MTVESPDYHVRIDSQIAQYAHPEGLVQLGPIYHYWIDKHIRPRVAKVFGVTDALQFYAKYTAEALRQRAAPARQRSQRKHLLSMS